MTPRSLIVLAHRWAGLFMATFLIVVAVTGALLAFDTSLERLINPQLFVAEQPGRARLDLAGLAEAAEAAEPKAQVGYFSIPVPDEAAVLMAPRKDPVTGKLYALGFNHIFLDPFTGRELGRRQDGDLAQGKINVVPFLFQLHTSLAAGEVGGWLLGGVALLWTLDCLWSVYLTFPMQRDRFFSRWRPSWQVKLPSSTFRINFDLHRAGGLWLWPLLFVFAWSSVMFNLSPVYQATMRTLFGLTSFEQQLATLHPAHPADRPPLNWRQAEALGDAYAAQEAKRAGLKLGRPFGIGYIPSLGVYIYDVRASSDVGGRTWEFGVWVDGTTGQLQKVFAPKNAKLGDRIGTWLYALHWADFHDALAYRIVVSLTGLVITGLSGTGVYIWLVKRRGRVKRKVASKSRAA